MSYNTPPFRVDTNFFWWIDVFTFLSPLFFSQFFFPVLFYPSSFLFQFALHECVRSAPDMGEKSKKKKQKEIDERWALYVVLSASGE